VSVYLRFERELRDRLDLPVSDISTTFWEQIDVRDEELKVARMLRWLWLLKTWSRGLRNGPNGWEMNIETLEC